jgi:DNA (cytosine-5)-methyltransferase 1
VTLTNISLFSGAGGLDLGAKLVGGFKTVAYCEFDRYAQAVLMSRMRDGGLDDAPIFEDVRTFDGRSLKGRIDVVSGGFPCQDVSIAGARAGIKDGTRSGLWGVFARIICEIKPRFVLVENVGGLLSIDEGGGFGLVLRDLAILGFNVEWNLRGACQFGAPHTRERVFIVGHSRHIYPRASAMEPRKADFGNRKPVEGFGFKGGIIHQSVGPVGRAPGREGKTAWPSEPRINRVVDGVADQLDRLRLCGNGVVPQQAAPAWQKIKDLAGVK